MSVTSAPPLAPLPDVFLGGLPAIIPPPPILTDPMLCLFPSVLVNILSKFSRSSSVWQAASSLSLTSFSSSYFLICLFSSAFSSLSSWISELSALVSMYFVLSSCSYSYLSCARSSDTAALSRLALSTSFSSRWRSCAASSAAVVRPCMVFSSSWIRSRLRVSLSWMWRI